MSRKLPVCLQQEIGNLLGGGCCQQDDDDLHQFRPHGCRGTEQQGEQVLGVEQQQRGDGRDGHYGQGECHDDRTQQFAGIKLGIGGALPWHQQIAGGGTQVECAECWPCSTASMRSPSTGNIGRPAGFVATRGSVYRCARLACYLT